MTSTTDARPGSETAEVSLVISGMTCGACAARIERRLNLLEGVEARVNYASERATAVLPADVPVERLIAEVSAAGYTAELPGLEAGQATDGPEEVDRPCPVPAPPAVRVRPALHASVRHVHCLLGGAESALRRVAVAHDRAGGTGRDLGGVALLPSGDPRRPPPRLDHGHLGVVGHRVIDAVVLVRHVLARHQPSRRTPSCSCWCIVRPAPSTWTWQPE